jgi:hypothetical protein
MTPIQKHQLTTILEDAAKLVNNTDPSPVSTADPLKFTPYSDLTKTATRDGKSLLGPMVSSSDF